MITLTKEWLQQTIAELEEERDAVPGAVNEDAAKALAAMKLALASLEAEPVAEVCEGFTLRYIGYGPAPKSGVHIGDRLFTAPSAPVSVPDDVSGPLAHAYKELTPTFMRNHIDVFERYGIYPDGSAGIQAMRIALDGMNRRDAMLQGAEPVTTAYKLPPHIYRELVNRLRDTAVKYQGCQQLREQLSRTLQEVIQPAAPQQEEKAKPKK